MTRLPQARCQNNRSYGLTAFAWLVVIFLFGTYPIALLPPPFNPVASQFRLPSVFLLTVVALPTIALVRLQLSRLHAISLSVYGALHLYHWVIAPEYSEAVFASLGLLIIPLTCCLYAHRNQPEPRRIGLIFSLLWLVQVVYGALSYLHETEVVGTALNRNWLAIVVVALAPWVVYTLYRCLCISCSSRIAIGIASGCALLPTLFLLERCRSEAAWLAIVGYAWFFLWTRLSNSRKAILAALTCLVIVALMHSFGSQIRERMYVADIRLPTWTSTLKLIVDHPLTGVGPGRYARAHTPYRTESDYHQRVLVADITAHPHNELLHIAANCGVPAALAWLAIILVLLRSPVGCSIMLQLAHYSASVIIMHGMLDRPLVSPPSNLIALSCLGLYLCRYIDIDRTNTPHQWYRHRSIRWLFGCVTALWVSVGIAVGTKSTIVSWHLRRGKQYSIHNAPAAALDCYRKVVRLDSTDIRGHYGAGVVALYGLLQPALAADYLETVQQLDPNYAHINQLLGRTYGTAGNHAKALAFFERERTLFPSSITAAQDYFFGLVRNRSYEPISAIDAELSALYVSRMTPAFQRSAAIHVQRWWEAVTSNDIRGALEQAQQAVRALPISGADPMLDAATSGNSWPYPFVFQERYRSPDHQYWRCLQLRERLRSSSDAWTVNSIFELVMATIAITPDDRHLKAPIETYEHHTGNHASITLLISWLYDASLPLIIQSPAGEPTMSGWLADEFAVYELDYASKTVKRHPYIHETHGIRRLPNSITAHHPDLLKSARLVVMPQTMLIRNHILETLAASLTGITTSPTMPAVKMVNASAFLQTFGLSVRPEDTLYQPIFEIVSTAIQQLEP